MGEEPKPPRPPSTGEDCADEAPSFRGWVTGELPHERGAAAVLPARTCTGVGREAGEPFGLAAASAVGGRMSMCGAEFRRARGGVSSFFAAILLAAAADAAAAAWFGSCDLCLLTEVLGESSPDETPPLAILSSSTSGP